MKRRLIQGLLFAVLLCGAVLLVHPTVAWADVEPTKPAQGAGTAGSPYEIGTVGELTWFAKLVNGTLPDGTSRNNRACATLTADIILEGTWTPMGSLDTPYYGTFDGAGHTISGLNLQAGEDTSRTGYGFFAALDYGGVVKNLTLVNGSIRISGSSGSNYIGGICGRNNGGIIENCTNKMEISGDEISNVGGICGLNIDESGIGVISNCVNNSKVDAGYSSGGICGYNSGIVRGCSNNAPVNSATDTDGVTVGGICGTNIAKGSINACSNSGKVNGSEMIGGICGDNSGSIASCNNNGAIEDNGVRGTNVYVGGLCGHNTGTISHGDNAGMVSGSGNAISGKERGTIGGICGWNRSGSLVACSNNGTVSKGTYIGGICGKNNATILSCSNSSNNVSGSTANTTACVGGLCGDNTGSITNSQSNGVVSSSGVMGLLSGQNSGTIGACYYLTRETLPAVGIGSGAVQAEAVTSDDVASGKLAWQLNQWTDSEGRSGKVWAVGEKGAPILNGKDDNTVVCLTFNANTGSDSSVTLQYANAGAAFPLVSAPVREGYTFVGWNTEADGTGTTYTAGTSTTPSVDTTLYAQWTNGYVLTLSTAEMIYNGQVQQPEMTVQWQGQRLVEGQDYIVTYSSQSVDVGTYTVTITGIGNYTGTASATYSIVPATLTITDVEIVEKAYDGSTVAIVNSVTFSGVQHGDTLASGSDYIATAVFATADAGTDQSVTVTVTLNNKNYTFEKGPTTGCKTTGTIVKVAYDGTVTASGTIQSGRSGAVTLPVLPEGASFGTPTTTDTAAVQDLSIIDYELHYNGSNIRDGATYTVTIPVTGSKNFYDYTITVMLTGEGSSTGVTPPVDPPTVSEKTIDAIQDAQPGETVTVDLSHGSTKLDKEVFETLAGKDVSLVVELGDGLSWTVKGTDIPENADFVDLDLGVTMGSDGIPVDLINAITGEHGSVQVELAHDGAFGFTMTLTAPLGEENSEYWANLYHYDEDAGEMTFETAAQIGDDGSVSLPLSHASQYAIVIDDHNHGVIDLPFTDVSEGDWFYDPVCFVFENGLMTGTSATTFEPNTRLSRAMLVAVLHRLEGSPAASAGDFTDVADGDWYAQAVNWAASVGVVNGFDDGTFQPNTAITREQMAAILRNYAAYKGLDVSASGDLNTYTDANSVSDWAKESVEWAVDQGLISGMTVDTLEPQGLSTRAQVAAVLQRYLAN